MGVFLMENEVAVGDMITGAVGFNASLVPSSGLTPAPLAGAAVAAVAAQGGTLVSGIDLSAPKNDFNFKGNKFDYPATSVNTASVSAGMKASVSMGNKK